MSQLPQTSAEDEAYNGRVTDKYSWSQTITEVDVTVPVGPLIKKGKQMQVTIDNTRVFVAETGSSDSPILDGNLSFPVKKGDCYWNLLPGECVRIFLQKGQERWWQALIEGEELLEMNKIEAERPMEELDEEEQMKLQELCWNEERKKQGLPTSEEMKMHKILEKAWNVEGSPFKGTPLDPSSIQIGTQGQGSFIQAPHAPPPPSDS